MTPTENQKLLRITDVMELTAFSRSYIYARAKRGEFPKPINLGYKCSRWVAGDIEEWIRQQRA